MKDLYKSWDSQNSIDEVPCLPCNIPEDLDPNVCPPQNSGPLFDLFYIHDPDVVNSFIHVQVIYRKYHKGPWDIDKAKDYVIYIYLFICSCQCIFLGFCFRCESTLE